MYDNIIVVGVTILLLFTFGFTLKNDRKQFLYNKSKTEFIPTAICLTLVLTLIFTLTILNQRDKSPSILTCITENNDFNSASIDFREDGTYKMSISCLGEDNYRGSYTLKDNIITLDKSTIENVIKTNTLLVSSNVADTASGIKNRVIQIDKNGREILNAIEFIVR